MRELLPFWLLIASGAMMASQATMNAALGKSLGIAFFTVVFSAIQLACTIPVLFVWGWPPKWETLAQTPVWQYIGGTLGVVILSAMSFSMARSSTFAAIVALLVGQLGMGIAIDRFGLFGMPSQPVSLARVVGLVFVVAGALLARR